MTKLSTGVHQVEVAQKWKSSDGIVQKLGLLVLARCEELIPLVDGGEVLYVHDGVLFHQLLVDVPQGAYLDHSYA